MSNAGRFSSGSFEAITGLSGLAGRASTIFGEATVVPPASMQKPSQLSTYLQNMKDDARPDVSGGGLIATGLGAAAGGYLYKKHRVLGAIGGASIGHNALALLDDGDRRIALCNLGQTGAGVVASLYLRKHPIIGFLLGWIAGGTAIELGGLRR